jgi:coenzyme F420 hydrogenase subunit beta
MSQTCTFVRNQTRGIEQRLHGRTRQDGEKGRFGIDRAMYAARMARPNPQAQWTGIVKSPPAKPRAYSVTASKAEQHREPPKAAD